MSRTAVIIPNLNGVEFIGQCLDSLKAQSDKTIVVENGSMDGSLDFLKKNYPDVELIINKVNRGFAGGVNQGIKKSIADGVDYVALFNNDAVAEKDWLKHLVQCLENNPEVGIATCKFLTTDGKKIDSTGDMYTNWGIPFPRGRDDTDITQFDKLTAVFGASGGASIYRVKMLNEVGLFDEDFFAYFEDVDISFRAQLAGWKVRYVPSAVAYHQIGATSSNMKGFNTYHSLKNYWLLFYKNVPQSYFKSVGIRLGIAWFFMFLGNIVRRRHPWSALKGGLMAGWLILHKRAQRKEIQSNKKVSDEYIWSIIVHDLPHNAYELRKLRSVYWKITGRKNA